MFPWADLQADRVSPSEEFVTTYRSDFRPMSERQPWLRIRPAPGFTSQDKCETRPVFVYKATSLDHVGSQHPSGSPFPTFLPSLSSAPGFSEAAVGSTLREASVQAAGVPKETRLLLGVGSTAMLEQLEPKDGFQYQDGVILLWQDADTLSCEDVLRILGKETGAQFLPSQLVVSGPNIGPGVFNYLLVETENWQNHLKDLSPVRTFSPEWTPGRPAGYIETKDITPPSCQIGQCLVCGQQRPTRTEYQERFCASLRIRPEESSTFTSIHS